MIKLENINSGVLNVKLNEAGQTDFQVIFAKKIKGTSDDNDSRISNNKCNCLLYRKRVNEPSRLSRSIRSIQERQGHYRKRK